MAAQSCKKGSRKARKTRFATLDVLVKETSVDTRVDEISNALETASKSLDERIYETKLTEMVKPVVEQESDANSFMNIAYAIKISGYDTAAYGEQKPFTYYQSSNSASQRHETNEHTFLIEAQEIAQNVKQGEQTNRPYVDAQIDDRLRHIRNTASIDIGFWRVIYDAAGKITFN